jgi:arginase family enzyme
MHAQAKSNLQIIVAPFDHGSRRSGASAGANEMAEIAVTSGIESRPIRLRRESGEFGCNELYEVVRETRAKGDIPLVLGGDHRITAYAYAGAQSVCGSLQLLVFDAHHDAYATGQFNHYTVMHVLGRLRTPVFGAGQRWELSGQERPISDSPKTDAYLSLDVDYFAPEDMSCVGHAVPPTLHRPSVEEFASLVRERAPTIKSIDVVEWFGTSGVAACKDRETIAAVFKVLGEVFQ